MATPYQQPEKAYCLLLGEMLVLTLWLLHAPYHAAPLQRAVAGGMRQQHAVLTRGHAGLPLQPHMDPLQGRESHHIQSNKAWPCPFTALDCHSHSQVTAGTVMQCSPYSST